MKIYILKYKSTIVETNYPLFTSEFNLFHHCEPNLTVKKKEKTTHHPAYVTRPNKEFTHSRHASSTRVIKLQPSVRVKNTRDRMKSRNTSKPKVKSKG